MAAQILAGLIASVALLLPLAAAAQPADLKTPQTPWSALPVEEKRILAPLSGDWDRLPGYQQKRLLSTTRKYPEMQPIQRERFQERITDWATMSPDQRRAARETFQGLQKLPPEKQHELRERWLKKREGGADPGSNPPPSR